MFTFTKFPICLLLPLLVQSSSIQGVPIDRRFDIKSILANLPNEVSTLGGGEVSGLVATTASAETIFTVVTSVGGPGITLAGTGIATVFNGATYTVSADLATATSALGSFGEASNATETSASISTVSTASVSASLPTSVSNSASTTASANPSSGSRTPAASSGSFAAESSVVNSTKSNREIALRPIQFSTPLARGLLTVAAGIIFGAWCI